MGEQAWSFVSRQLLLCVIRRQGSLTFVLVLYSCEALPNQVYCRFFLFVLIFGVHLVQDGAMLFDLRGTKFIVLVF